jgi:nucleoside-diphosphate-sugar epimerase
MSLLITGGLGFLGIQTARQFIKRGRVYAPRYGRSVPIEQITLFDKFFPEHDLPTDITSDTRVRVMTGDLTEDGVASEIVDDDSLSVVHLASMVSGDTEQDHLRGWNVNVEGQRLLLEALREKAPGARFVFTSSTAALGPVPDDATHGADDLTKLLPQNTYGFHKAVCELMVNDYARRGFVDARCLRLPVIVVRPGAPNAALTGAWSSVVREPLNGEDVLIPIPMDVRLPVASYQSVVANLAHLLDEVDGEALGPDRTLMLPSLSASPRDLFDAAAALAAQHGLAMGSADAREQELATRIVRGMGERSDGRRAEALGCVRDESPASIVQAYAEDYVLGGR